MRGLNAEHRSCHAIAKHIPIAGEGKRERSAAHVTQTGSLCTPSYLFIRMNIAWCCNIRWDLAQQRRPLGGIHKEATRRPFDSLGSELNHLATTTLCSNIVGIIYDALVVTHTSTHLRSSTMCSVIIKVGSSVNIFFKEPQSTLLLLQRCHTSTTTALFSVPYSFASIPFCRPGLTRVSTRTAFRYCYGVH